MPCVSYTTCCGHDIGHWETLLLGVLDVQRLFGLPTSRLGFILCGAALEAAPVVGAGGEEVQHRRACFPFMDVWRVLGRGGAKALDRVCQACRSCVLELTCVLCVRVAAISREAMLMAHWRATGSGRCPLEAHA